MWRIDIRIHRNGSSHSLKSEAKMRRKYNRSLECLGRQKLVREYASFGICTAYFTSVSAHDLRRGTQGISGEQSTNNESPCQGCHEEARKWVFSSPRRRTSDLSASTSISLLLCCMTATLISKHCRTLQCDLSKHVRGLKLLGCYDAGVTRAIARGCAVTSTNHGGEVGCRPCLQSV